MHTATSQSESALIDRLLAWYATVRNGQGKADMPALRDKGVVDEIARDLGVPPDVLLQLAKADPHAADEMTRMMRALNIDSSEVETDDAAAFRDMQATCAACAFKSRCRSDLAAETAAEHFDAYCGNADRLNALRAEPQLLRD